MKGINEWINKIKTDQKFAEENDGQTIEKVLKLARREGYDISKDDIIKKVSGGKIGHHGAEATAISITTGKGSSSEERSSITINM